MQNKINDVPKMFSALRKRCLFIKTSYEVSVNTIFEICTQVTWKNGETIKSTQ